MDFTYGLITILRNRDNDRCFPVFRNFLLCLYDYVNPWIVFLEYYGLFPVWLHLCPQFRYWLWLGMNFFPSIFSVLFFVNNNHSLSLRVAASRFLPFVFHGCRRKLQILWQNKIWSMCLQHSHHVRENISSWQSNSFSHNFFGGIWLCATDFFPIFNKYSTNKLFCSNRHGAGICQF